MRINRFLAIGLLACVGAPGSAFAIDPSGTAVDVVPATDVTGVAGARALTDDDPIFMGDVVKTGQRGSAQIKFVDDTKLVVGPNSQVTIDSFVFQSKTTAKSFSLNAVQGTFRFITGVSAKNVYSIKTPSATIGVRGTEFDFAVDRNGTHVGLWGGQLQVCDRSVPRRCTIVAGHCSVLVVTPQRRFVPVNNIFERTAVMNALFPYAFRQHRLQPQFRVDSGGCSFYDTNPATAPGFANPDPPPTVNPATPPDLPDDDGGGDGPDID